MFNEARVRYSVIRFALGLASALWVGLGAAVAQVTLDDGFVQEQLAAGLNPSAMAMSPDGRLFIVEKGGRVLVYRDGRLLPEPFLELDVDDYNERGLSGISFHPDFLVNGLLYAYYTVPRAGYNRISRFRTNGDFAIPDSEEVVFELEPVTSSVHNGGAMAWLPDGTLLVATGDGGVGQTAQDPQSLLGKVLRITAEGDIPADNPYYDAYEGIYRAIYALGLRNPFTMAMSRRTGQLFANDVGNVTYEEINEIVAGANYGWPLVEGRLGLDQAPPRHREALYEYDHGFGCAVVGAAWYEPRVEASFPAVYHDRYLFGDYCRGFILALDPATGRVERELARGLDRVIALAVDSLGSVYYLGRGTGDGGIDDNTAVNTGTLWRIRYTGSGAPVVSRGPQDLLVPRGEDARFEVRASGAPPYRYAWLVDDRLAPADTNRVLTLDTVGLADDGTVVRAIVTNAFGADTSAPARLTVTANSRPVLTIGQPLPTQRYAAGERLSFAGAGVDAEDGDLAPAALRWRVDFHHDDHTHPVTREAGVASGYIDIPTVGEVSDNVFYRVTLSAADADGLPGTTYVDVQPRKATLRFVTEPAGLELNADGYTEAAPFTLASVVGLERSVQAPHAQRVGGASYTFDSWDDGARGPVRYYTVGETAEQTFTARYVRVPEGEGTGLTARFYGGELGADGPVLVERVDSTIDFNWGWEAPAPGVPADGFSAVWTGLLEAPYAGDYTLTTATNDGVRLYVDGQLLIDDWEYQELSYHSVTVSLAAGQRVPVRMEAFDWIRESVAQLAWSHPRLPAGIVPRAYLYPEGTASTPGTTSPQLLVRPVGGLDQQLVAFIQLPAGAGSGEVGCRLVDALGRAHGEVRVVADEAFALRALPFGALAPGLYHLQVRFETQVVGVPVVVGG